MKGIDMTLSRADRERLLLRIDALVSARFYDPKFHGKKWQEIVARNREAILSAGSTDAFEASVAAMLGELQANGLGLLSSATKIPPANSINASFHVVETAGDGMRWVFQDVLPGGVAQRAKIKAGEALIRINDVEVRPPRLPEFPMNSKIPVVVSQSGRHRDAELDLTTSKPKYKSNPYSEPMSVDAKVRSSSIGTIKISLFPGFIGIDFANALSSILGERLSTSSRLVVDLRGNPGGGIGGLRLMSYMTPDRRPVGFSVDRKAAERGYNRETLPRLNHIPKSKIELPLLLIRYWDKKSVVLETEGMAPQPFHGRIVLLVNEHTAGAAEMVAQFAQENALGVIVGSHTPGRLISRSAFRIGEGYRLVVPVAAYVSWNGKQIEGTGIRPDVPVDWSYDDALHGIDNQYERALEVAAAL
jgi:C-terminal processing protease CtpA/Prc